MNYEERAETYFSETKSIKTTNSTKSTQSQFNASLSFNEFINNNRHFFAKLGLENLMNDPIFKLKDNEEIKPEGWCDLTNSFKEDFTNSCNNCKELPSNLTYSKYTYCRFCGSVICDNCKATMSTRRGKQACECCERKFKFIDSQSNFKCKFEKIEIDIKEASRSAESIGIQLSESTNEIEKLRTTILNLKLHHKDDLSKIDSQKQQVQQNQINCENDCIELSDKKNVLIESFKQIDDEFNQLDNEYKTLNLEREKVYKDFITSQDKLNRLNRENQELTVQLNSYNSQINKRIIIDFTKEASDIFAAPLSDDEQEDRKKYSQSMMEPSRSEASWHPTNLKGALKKYGSRLLNN